MSATTTTTMTTAALNTMQIIDLNKESDPALLSPTICRVRFDSECVLIPEPSSPSRMPRLLKKSYSLPLWRKKPPSVVAAISTSSSASSSEDQQQQRAASPSASSDDNAPSRFGFSR
ncbi:hypothetical protein EIP91_003284, partial [Steccherinum ochraceum]